jgi:hypothetical protein
MLFQDRRAAPGPSSAGREDGAIKAETCFELFKSLSKIVIFELSISVRHAAHAVPRTDQNGARRTIDGHG